MRPSRAVTLVALGLSPVAALDVTGRLVDNTVLTTASLPLNSRIDIDFGAASARILADGSFKFPLGSGRHVLRPVVPGYDMTDIVLTVPVENEDSEQQEQPHAQPFVAGRALASKAASLPFPLEIGALGLEDYYTPAAGVNILQMLKSPMVLMMLASAVMAIALPKIQSTLEADPEVKAGMAQHRQQMNKGLQMDWSGTLAGKLAGGGEDQQQPGSATPPDSGAGSDQGGAQAATRQAAGRGGKRGGKRR